MVTASMLRSIFRAPWPRLRVVREGFQGSRIQSKVWEFLKCCNTGIDLLYSATLAATEGGLLPGKVHGSAIFEPSKLARRH